MENQPEVPNEKMQAWNALNEELTQYGTKTEGRPPGEDIPIDPNIREAVAGLNSLGIRTTASCEGHETPEYISFPMLQGILEDPDENDAVREKVEQLLNEFNAGRDEKYKLQLHSEVTSGYRMESAITKQGEKEMDALYGNMSEDDRERIAELLKGAQAEFAAFTEFLKQKYFSEGIVGVEVKS